MEQSRTDSTTTPGQETVDRIGPDTSRARIAEAIAMFAGESQAVAWSRRRARLIHLTNLIERNLDEDLERLQLATSA